MAGFVKLPKGKSVFRILPPLGSVRHVAVRPTWTIDVLPDKSSGIEPVFTQFYKRRTNSADAEFRYLAALNERIILSAFQLDNPCAQMKSTGIYDADKSKAAAHPDPIVQLVETANPTPYPRATERAVAKGDRCYLCSLQAQFEFESSATSRFLACLGCVDEQLGIIPDELGNGHFRMKTPYDR